MATVRLARRAATPVMAGIVGRGRPEFLSRFRAWLRARATDGQRRAKYVSLEQALVAAVSGKPANADRR